MSNVNGLLHAYMADDPNLIIQPAGTGNGTDDIPGENAQPLQDNTQNTATATNATQETTNAVAEEREEDVAMTNLQGHPGEAATGVGTVLTRGGYGPAAWIGPHTDSETRKRKERSPSLVNATDGGGQSADSAGAHKRIRATTVTSSDVPAQTAENGAVESQDSATRPWGSGSEGPEQSQSMPGALPSTGVGCGSSQSTASAAQSLGTPTGGGAHPAGGEPSATATPPVAPDGLSGTIAAGHTPAVSGDTGVSGSSHAGLTSEVPEPSGGDGSPVKTTTPLCSLPNPTLGDVRPISAEDKTPSRDVPPPNVRMFKMPSTMNPASVRMAPGTAAVRGPGGEAGTDGLMPLPAVSFTFNTPNPPDPLTVLAQQFGGVRTEIRSMGTHMRTMSNSIGRLDNAMGTMTEQHKELMSVLRMSLAQPISPFAAAGQPPATHQTPAAGQPPAATSQHSLATVPPAARRPSASIVSRTPMRHAPTGPQPHATTSSRMLTPSSNPMAPTSRNRSSRALASSDDDMEVDEGDVADTEGNIPEALPVPVKASKLKLKGMPKARDPLRKALLDDIALMARKYMGREQDPEDDEDGDVLFFDETSVPCREEVDTFTGRDGQCCTIDNFRPDLLGTPRSTWNQSAAQVFAKEYVKASTAKSKDVKKVEREFGVHMKTLINSYKSFQASREANEAKRRKRRRYMRKAYAHQRRMMIAASHDELKRHVWTIQALGVQGMSSDESEHEGTKVRYRRTTLAWRNPTLETFFHVIDVFHDASRFTSGIDKSSKSGSHVHLRLPAHKTSERAAIPGLPLATYNPAWLNGLSEFFRNRLNISNIPYEFAHPPEVMKEMMQLLRPPPPEQTIPPLP